MASMRVGGLDDPIWAATVPVAPRPADRGIGRLTRRRLTVLVVVALLIIGD
jgi:hypothetical protein